MTLSIRVAVNFGHEGRRRRAQIFARLEQRAADQQHDVGSIEIKHLAHAIGGHAAGRHRNGGAQPLSPVQGRTRERTARIWGVAEASAIVREHHGVGPQHAEQGAQQQRGSNPRRPGHGGMRDEGHGGVLAHEPMEVRETHNHRRDHDGVDADVPSERDVGAHGVEIAREARHVARRPAAGLRDASQRGCDRFEARRERRIGLVGEPMVVLDVIDAALRKILRELGEPCRRQALRLERRAGQSPRRRADPPPQLIEPVAGTAEDLDQVLGKRDVGEYHVLVQRRVAEQHVDELPGIAADGRHRERDADLEQAVVAFGNGLDAADDLGAHEIVLDRRDRHLDALLDRNGTRALLDRARIAAHEVDGLQTRVHGRLLSDHRARSAKLRAGCEGALGNSPPLADRRAAEHFDDARARRGGGVVGQRIGGKEAVSDDLAIGDRRRRLAEREHDEERDVIAPGGAIVEENSMQPRRRRHLDVALLAQLPRDGPVERFAGLDPAARQVPAADVAVLDQENAPVRVDHQRARAERHRACEAPIDVQQAPQRRLERTAGPTEAEGFHAVAASKWANRARLVKSASLLSRRVLTYDIYGAGTSVKRFAELTEQEILALAITNEDEDSRIYRGFAEGLREKYPASAKVFDEMAEEEVRHRTMLFDLYRTKFGEYLPLIRRQDVKGFIQKKPLWLMHPLNLDEVRKFAENMEYEAARFYRRATETSRDTSVRQLLVELAEAEAEHESLAHKLGEQILTPSARAKEDETARRMFLLQYVQPGLAGLMDGSVSTLAPLFAAAFATHNTWETFLVGLAASVGAGISMGFAEALSDDGSLTGRGAPLVRGVVCGVMTAIGGLGHTLPYLIPNFWTATAVAIAVVAVELAAISYIRHRFMDTPFLQATFQVVVGGVLVFVAGILIGSS